MDFRSDNTGAAAPEIIESIHSANLESCSPYGDDDYTKKLQKRFAEIFETDVTVLTAITGTAANAIALSALTPPYGVIYCHSQSHIATDECGSPELMSGGAKLVTVGGRQAKISLGKLEHAVEHSGSGFVHCAQPAVVSITQSTEMGAVYSLDELAAINDITTKNNLKIHMDGARFANALVSLGATPADMTWRSGVDILSFGATKNGACLAEAIVLFRKDLAEDLAFRHKRAGQLVSKGRFIATQLLAYTTDDLWLNMASKANRFASNLASRLAELDGAELESTNACNEVFVTLPKPVIDGLRIAGAQFYGWPEPWDSSRTIRLVTRWDTKESEIDEFIFEVSRLLVQNRKDIPV